MLIVEDLIGEASDLNKAKGRPFLALFVDPRNSRAVALYQSLGFVRHSREYPEPVTGITYVSMVLAL